MQNSLVVLIEELINIGGFKYEWSFHTITFNITENYNKNDLKKAIDTYIRWLKILYKDILYIYTHEISEDLNIHIHLMLNKVIKKGFKDQLLKDWNKYNNWEWYYKTGILIKNNDEYEDAIETNKLIKDVPYIFNYDISKKIYDNAYIVLNYMFKDIFDANKILKLNYILYPLNLIGGSLKKNEQFDILIKALNNLYKKVIFEWANKNFKIEDKAKLIKNPFLEDIVEKNKLNYLFNNWKLKFEFSEKAIIKFITDINLTEDIDKKQELLEDYLIQKQDSWNELKLYNMKNTDLKLLNDLFLLKLKLKINKQYKLIQFLEDINNTIYYVLEGLVKVVRYFKKEYRAKEVENFEFSYTESYFKILIREMYITNIIHKNLKELKLLYQKDNLQFLNTLILKDEFILNFFKENQSSQDFYKKNHIKIESELGIWIDLLLEVLYEIDIIEKINNISIFHIDVKQNYFTLSNKFLNYLIFEEYMYEIIPPLLKKPKDYNNENENNEYIGGYHKISNILFSENENLEYKISFKNLKIINENQKLGLKINVKYLYYLLNSEIKTIEKLTGLGLQNYNENYLDAKIADIKKVPDIFLIHEFFLSLYIALNFKNENLWFISKLDERGRKYDIGYPLNFYRDKILRNLFIWNKEIIEDCINESFNFKNKHFIIYKNYFKQIIDKEKEYNLYNILESPLECLVGFDATNQIYQIIGGLLKNIKLLEFTKVIKTNNNNNNNDIYYYFLNKIKIILYNNEELKLLIKRINNMISHIKSGIKIRLELSIEYLLDNLDRTWIKNILMTYGYNKSLISLIDTTNKHLSLTVFKDNKNVCTSYYIKNEVNKISSLIIKELLSYFNNEFKTLSNLKLIFNSLIIISKLLKCFVYITTNNFENGGFSQYYLKMEYVSFQKWRAKGENDKGKKIWTKVSVTYPKIQEENIALKKLDFKKNLNALLPNTCHYLDSLLMYNIIKDLTDQKIPIKTIHDSFYTNIKYKDIISDIYKKNYIKLFKFNLLEQIIQNALNEFTLIPEFFDLIVILNQKYNQNIIKTPIIQWNLFTKKDLLELHLDPIKLKLYDCLLKINKNYKIINKSELMNIDLEAFILSNNNEEMII